MRKAIWMILSGAIGVSALTAGADTLFLKDGTSVNGEVSYPNENAVAVSVGGRGRMVFPAADVDRVEKNTKTGSSAAAAITAKARAHDEELTKATGLTKEQRAKVRQLMKPLGSPDPMVRANARKEIVAFAQKVDLFDYLAGFARRALPHNLRGILEALFDLDAKRAGTACCALAEHPLPIHRAEALLFLAQAPGTKHQDLILRGLVDSDARVQIAAIHATARCGLRSATPVLIGFLDANDARVRNASSAALSRLWSTAETVLQFETSPEWRAHWKAHGGGKIAPVSASSLKPLAEPLPEGAAADYG